MEIEAALRNFVRIVPVLLDGAPLPRAPDLPQSLLPIRGFNAVQIAHATFHRDAERLSAALPKLVDIAKEDKKLARAVATKPTEPKTSPLPVAPAPASKPSVNSESPRKPASP